MTIKDIARLSGVGISTVSRVLNGRPDVSEESRQRVQAVIAEHNYLPNNSARSLVRTKSDAIGLVVRGMQNPFYINIIRSIQRRLEQAGYTMVISLIRSTDDEVQCGAVLEREKRLQGIIFLGGRSNYTPSELSLLNVPFVCCSYDNAYGSLDPAAYSSVTIADEQESCRAVQLLLEKGHTRIAILAASEHDSSISQLRCAGYARALREAGLANAEDVIDAGDFSIESAYRAMRERLARPSDFSALFAISDDMAIGAMRALRESGRRIPEDCSVIAIDGLPVSEYLSPILTTLCQPTGELGEKSAELLLSVIHGGAHSHLVLPTTLRSGQSVRDLRP